VLTLRRREETAPGSGQWQTVTTKKAIPAAELGVVVCDMWDLHWCRGATERADVIAGRMNPVLESLRQAGVQIVHAPSETMDFYRGTPQRLRAQLAPKATPPPAPTLPAEVPLPIDDSDGGCDTGDAFYLAWTRQNPKITIAEPDAVSDSGEEIFNLFREQGITHVLMMGVHTNMCVLNRTFAIKAMTRRGMNCILVRDLTDTMYNPASPPQVSHDEGTNLVIEHIEKYWCPSTTSEDLR
jgi:nicotinamidase-related amidase